MDLNAAVPLLQTRVERKCVSRCQNNVTKVIVQLPSHLAAYLPFVVPLEGNCWHWWAIISGRYIVPILRIS